MYLNVLIFFPLFLSPSVPYPLMAGVRPPLMKCAICCSIAPTQWTVSLKGRCVLNHLPATNSSSSSNSNNSSNGSGESSSGGSSFVQWMAYGSIYPLQARDFLVVTAQEVLEPVDGTTAGAGMDSRCSNDDATAASSGDTAGDMGGSNSTQCDRGLRKGGRVGGGCGGFMLVSTSIDDICELAEHTSGPTSPASPRKGKHASRGMSPTPRGGEDSRSSPSSSGTSSRYQRCHLSLAGYAGLPNPDGTTSLTFIVDIPSDNDPRLGSHSSGNSSDKVEDTAQQGLNLNPPTTQQGHEQSHEQGQRGVIPVWMMKVVAQYALTETMGRLRAVFTSPDSQWAQSLRTPTPTSAAAGSGSAPAAAAGSFSPHEPSESTAATSHSHSSAVLRGGMGAGDDDVTQGSAAGGYGVLFGGMGAGDDDVTQGSAAGGYGVLFGGREQMADLHKLLSSIQAREHRLRTQQQLQRMRAAQGLGGMSGSLSPPLGIRRHVSELARSSPSAELDVAHQHHYNEQFTASGHVAAVSTTGASGIDKSLSLVLPDELLAATSTATNRSVGAGAGGTMGVQSGFGPQIMQQSTSGIRSKRSLMLGGRKEKKKDGKNKLYIPDCSSAGVESAGPSSIGSSGGGRKSI